jgi:diguanylate cyclase (GGDEF)-like protein
LAIKTYLADIWSATDFRTAELAGYAEKQLRKDTRDGVQILALLSLTMQLSVLVLILYQQSGLAHYQTFLVLSVLSLHVMISAKLVDDVHALQALGMVLLIVSALAITFLAHRTGDLSIGTMAAIVMLFIAIPLVPWALRETAIVIGLTYLLLTLSLISVPGRFEPKALWVLQLLILGSTVIVVVVICRNTRIRKHNIRTRFELENAHKEMELLSMKDHLTGAWNRRYLDAQFPEFIDQCRKQRKTLHVAVLDIDNFKGINDCFGHHLADQILASLGAILIRHLGDQGSLIRLGGDEFQILYCGEDLNDLITEAVAELHNEPAAKELSGKRQITLSAGMSSAGPEQSADLERLYKSADKALYSAKNARRLNWSSENETESTGRTGTWRI